MNIAIVWLLWDRWQVIVLVAYPPALINTISGSPPQLTHVMNIDNVPGPLHTHFTHLLRN